MPEVAPTRHGVLLDYIELFVFMTSCHCLQHGIMYAEVYGQMLSRRDKPRVIPMTNSSVRYGRTAH